jgi:hypothetical protein
MRTEVKTLVSVLVLEVELKLSITLGTRLLAVMTAFTIAMKRVVRTNIGQKFGRRLSAHLGKNIFFKSNTY